MAGVEMPNPLVPIAPRWNFLIPENVEAFGADAGRSRGSPLAPAEQPHEAVPQEVQAYRQEGTVDKQLGQRNHP